MLIDAEIDPTIVRLSDGFPQMTGYDQKFAAGRSPKFFALRSRRFENLANGGEGGELAYLRLKQRVRLIIVVLI